MRPALSVLALALALLLLLPPRAAGWEDGEEREKTGFEAAAEWARFAHGFPEEDLVLDDMEADGHAHETVIEVQANSGEGLLQFAFKLVAEGIFGASGGAGGASGAGAPEVQVVAGSHDPADAEASASDGGGELSGMEILDDEDGELAGATDGGEPSDEFHQVDAVAAEYAAGVRPCMRPAPSACSLAHAPSRSG